MAYTPTNWTNFPSTATPVNASNLNKIETELVALDTGKADATEVNTALEEKVDKVAGKGLSTNDYDNTAKGIVDGVTSALAEKVDKVEGKGLSTNDFDNTYKDKLDGISAQANKVEITTVVTEGTTLATISIDGVDTDIKGSDIEVDDEMSPTSPNPVQNKVIYDTLQSILPEETAEGNPISISDASGLSAKSCEVAFTPIQDLHGQSAPYPAGGGKNKYSGTDMKTTSDGSAHTDYNMSLPAGTYTFSAQVTSDSGDSSVAISLRNSQNTQIRKVYIDVSSSRQSTTVTIEEDVAKMYFYAGYDTTTKANTTYSNIQIESGSSMTDYAPYSNICPISGRDSLVLGQAGSKNIFGPNTTTQQAYIKSDGSIQSNNDFTVSDYIKVSPNTILTFNPNSLGGNSAYNAFYTENKTLISVFLTNASDNKWTFKTPSNCAYMRFSYRNISSNIQLEYGDTATEYAPFISECVPHTATFPDTVYGGVWKPQEGKAIIDTLYHTFTSLEYYGAYGDDNAPLFYGVLPNYIRPYFDNSYPTDDKPISNMYKAISTNKIRSMINNEMRTREDTQNNRVYFRDDRFDNKTDMNNWLTNNPIQFCGKLYTSIEITLTPEVIELLKGANVLWTDGDNITLKYSADIKAYIDSQLNS